MQDLSPHDALLLLSQHLNPQQSTFILHGDSSPKHKRMFLKIYCPRLVTELKNISRRKTTENYTSCYNPNQGS